jgi:transcriptional regulator with XRE-family HTH domain
MKRQPNESSVAFGALLKEARDAAGLSTEELANDLHVVRETADRWMRGERRPDRTIVVQWEKLCGAAIGSLVGPYDELPPVRRHQPKPDDRDLQGGGFELTEAPTPPPVHPPEPNAPKPPRGQRSRGLILLGAAVALAVLLSAGYVAGTAGGGDDPKPIARYAAGLTAVTSRLDRARVVLRRKLRTEPKPEGQAVAARQARQAFASAIRSVAKLPVSGYERGVTMRLLASLARGRDAYGAMAKAAGGHDSAAFAAAAARVALAERDMQSILAALRRLGY